LPPTSTPFPYTTLFRSLLHARFAAWSATSLVRPPGSRKGAPIMHGQSVSTVDAYTAHREWARRPPDERYASVQELYDAARARRRDRKSTRLNSSHVSIS